MSNQKFDLEVPPEEEIIIQHGKAGHRHTSEKDRCGYWCQDNACPHWVREGK